MLLLEYRDVINKSKDVDDEMLCIEKILKFYRSEFNRSDLYTEYIYKLYEIHFKSKNFTEAAFTLLEHANRIVKQYLHWLIGNFGFFTGFYQGSGFSFHRQMILIVITKRLSWDQDAPLEPYLHELAEKYPKGPIQKCDSERDLKEELYQRPG